MDRFLTKISDYIDSHCPIDKQSLHLVALSGGADSVCLLLALRQLGYRVEAAHCNFHLRGDESDRDEEFCRSLCQECGIKLHLVHFDTREFASLRHVSIEMAARDLRYDWFRRLAHDIGAADICVGHHLEDSAETVILNLIRGTGIHGLAGISPFANGVARPMLSCSRKEIEEYLNRIGQSYVTDSSNLEDEAQRNKIRLSVLPILRSINPSASENISRTADYVRQACKVFDSAIEQSVARVFSDDRIDVSLLKKEIAPEYVLFSILSKYSFSSAQIDEIFSRIDSQDTLEWKSKTHQLLLSRGMLIIEEVDDESFHEMIIPEPGRYVCSEGCIFEVSIEDCGEDYTPSRNPDEVTLDADKMSFPLLLRRVKEGDRFVPYGMRGTRLLSDFLTDNHKNLFEKRRQLIVADGEGRIAWVVGMRTDNRFAVDDATKRVARIKFRA